MEYKVTSQINKSLRFITLEYVFTFADAATKTASKLKDSVDHKLEKVKSYFPTPDPIESFGTRVFKLWTPVLIYFFHWSELKGH